MGEPCMSRKRVADGGCNCSGTETLTRAARGAEIPKDASGQAGEVLLGTALKIGAKIDRIASIGRFIIKIVEDEGGKENREREHEAGRIRPRPRSPSRALPSIPPNDPKRMPLTAIRMMPLSGLGRARALATPARARSLVLLDG